MIHIIFFFALLTCHIRNTFCEYYTESVELEDLETMFWKQWYNKNDNTELAYRREIDNLRDNGERDFIASHRERLQEIIAALSGDSGFRGNPDIFLEWKDINHHIWDPTTFRSQYDEARRAIEARTYAIYTGGFHINFYAMHPNFPFLIENEPAMLMTKQEQANDNVANERIFLAVVLSYSDNLQFLGYFILGHHANLPKKPQELGIVAFADYNSKSIYHVSKKLSGNCLNNIERDAKRQLVTEHLKYRSRKDDRMQINANTQSQIRRVLEARERRKRESVSPNVRFLREKYGANSAATSSSTHSSKIVPSSKKKH